MKELDEVKAYLRIDGTEEDELLISLIASAKQYMANAGIFEDCDDPTWQLARNALTLQYYDHRDCLEIPTGVRSLLLQLRHGGLT